MSRPERHENDENITGEGKKAVDIGTASHPSFSILPNSRYRRPTDVETKNPIRTAEDTFRPVDLTVIYRREWKAEKEGEGEGRHRCNGGNGWRDRYFAKTNGRRKILVRYRSFLSPLRFSSFSFLDIEANYTNSRIIGNRIIDGNYPTWRDYTRHCFTTYPPLQHFTTVAFLFDVNPPP